ncbi:TonB-dependent receptor SusC [Polaribacter huanghezhanensis]|uniref:SusC/RagA family TonB-linked outer membrane protein n=1 Tax=Polaribacter huanghezhanensis TaxID=1354726 RepID=UPI002647F658|nr:SusC/RagA family TonB-linked outer membrane protein [Polaribacter huanghezhanensis]WKD84899.1 TonB-dependent receptor SusC [Polaribacter huanghezhanensis]
MKTKFNGILTLLLALVVQISFAQEKTVSGTVSDNSGALPGVSVLIKGTTTGTETDFDGKYSIKTKTGDVLSFRYLGYKTVEKTIGSSSTINVTMVEDANVLDEVVVTGLGIKRDKKALGFSQQSVEGEALVKAKETDISNALAGKISGVQIVGNNSSTFGSSQVKLRGESNVLYVVDGVKVYASSDINTDNVADISVLKGGSATAIYGPDGRNGVIVITTKQATKGAATIDVDYATTVNSVTNLAKYQNEYGGGYSQTFPTFAFDPSKDPASWAAFNGQKIPQYYADESWGPKLDGTLVRHWDSWIQGAPTFGELRAWSPSKNSTDSFYDISLTQNATVAFNKAEDNYSVRTSVSYIKQNGVVPNSKKEQTRIALNAKYNVSDKLEFYANINYENRSFLNNPEQGYGNLGSNFNQWWQRQLDFKRLRNYEQAGQIVSWNINGPRNTKPLYWDMPYFHSYENLRHNYKNAVYGKIGANYTLNDNIKITAEVRRTFNSYADDDRGTTKSLLDQSFYSESMSRASQKEFFAMANYNKKFMNDKLDVDVIAGTEITQNDYKRLSANTVGGLTIPLFYNLAGSKDAVSARTSIIQSESRSVFSKASIGYENMVYLDGSYRLDWKSTANPTKNRVDTYGVSASFLAHKVLPKNDILNFVKLRAGYSTSPFFPNAYQISSVYNVGSLYNGNGRLSVSNTQANPILEGGVRKELELGTEMYFFNNKLSLDLTYFNRKDEGIPVNVPLDGATGYTNTTVNAGKTSSSGIELGLSGDVIRTEDFTFGLSFNFATLSKKVDFIYDGVESRDLSTYTSRMKLQERVGQEWGLFYGTGFGRGANNEIMFRSRGSGRYSYSLQPNKFLGSLLPDFTGGITTNFEYKNMSLSLGFDFQKGGKYYSRTERYMVHSGLADYTAGLNDKGNPKRDPIASGGGVHIVGVLQTGTDASGNPTTDGTAVDTYVEAQDIYGLGNIGNVYENNLHDATYAKLRTIRFNYSLDKDFVTKFNIKSASIGAFANNVWLIYSDLPWIDPSEIEKRSGINWAEAGTLPSTRSIGLNLKLTF